MNRKHRATVRQIFSRPVPGNVRWTDFVSLMRAVGAEVRDGRGSRTRFIWPEDVAIFHRPHPSPYMDKGAVSAARKLLEDLGVTP